MAVFPNSSGSETPHADHPVGRTALSEAELRALVDLVPIGVFKTDAGGQVTFLNPMAKAISGRAETDSLADWHRVIHPDDSVRVMTGWQQTVGRPQRWESEHRIV